MALSPILMTPAYRFGEQTPWGGSALKTVFGKSIPDERTGEALEVSAIPGLCSRDQAGVPLDELIRKYGARLTGLRVGEPFPLLLKLLSARDKLSVQVHPDDRYAAAAENKLGKTEAWVILRAEPGAKLVYGIKPGVSKAELADALTGGAAVTELLRYVSVKEGETYFIPSGMVHAIGEGILLYEIQQSSDVTYRFYDWDRVDKEGLKRELHIQKALDVTNPALSPQAVVPRVVKDDAFGRMEQALDTHYFGLSRLKNCHGFPVARTPERFSILTALSPAEVAYDGGTLAMAAGETALLPADGHELSLTGNDFLLAYPSV